ncbi:MAG: 50S ribosomal protein L3 [Planctomycetota bacterium]|jgi:large subunit ribosomal protein L3
MVRGMLGRKVGMTQFWNDDGQRIGVTVIEFPENRVLQVKSGEREGYDALQLGIDEKDEKHSNKPEKGHSKASGGVVCRFVRELRLTDAAEVEAGATLSLTDTFEGVQKVAISGITKGKGFAGVMKRHGFGGYRATHGVKTHHRHPGSIGQCADPGKVFKGKKMPGQMGAKQVTTKGMKIVKLIPEKNVMLVKGAVPGANGGYLTVSEDVGYVAPKK